MINDIFSFRISAFSFYICKKIFIKKQGVKMLGKAKSRYMSGKKKALLLVSVIILPVLVFAQYTGGSYDGYAMNEDVEDNSLPVELSLFTATPGNGIITLKWLTESEIENLGFNIYRSTKSNDEFLMLNAELIAGAGSSSEKHEYSYVDQDVKNGITYWYKLEDIDYNGKTEFHGPISATVLGPKEFCLHSNYPNPFNPVTTISYDLAEDVYVELTVYNMIGEKVTTLVKGNQPAGYYNVEWDGRNSQGRIVPSGMYFLKISAGSYNKTNKMVFVK